MGLELPQQLVKEHSDVIDHVNALSGRGRQVVWKGRRGKVKDQKLHSFRCRANVRKGKGRRCRQMCRSTFPYCFIHSFHKIGVVHGKKHEGLIACRDFDKREVVCTVKSIQTGEILEKSTLYINDDDNEVSTAVCFSNANESTIGRYADTTKDSAKANCEYVVMQAEYHDTEKDEFVDDKIITVVTTKPIKTGDRIYVLKE
jgi:hypothetical protein